MPSRMVLGIKPVPDRLIDLQRLHPRLTLRELQGVAGKINALLAMSERHGEFRHSVKSLSPV